MVDVRVVRADARHAVELAVNMRAEDVAEVVALGLSPEESLLESIAKSDISLALIFNGEVAALWGVGPNPYGTPTGMSREGIAWALTGRAVAKHPKSFVRASRAGLEKLLELYPVLINVVDVRYAAALRWLKWLGFTEIGPVVAPSGQEFTLVELRRNSWAH